MDSYPINKTISLVELTRSIAVDFQRRVLHIPPPWIGMIRCDLFQRETVVTSHHSLGFIHHLCPSLEILEIPNDQV